jgi:hypothetical protein
MIYIKGFIEFFMSSVYTGFVWENIDMLKLCSIFFDYGKGKK